MVLLASIGQDYEPENQRRADYDSWRMRRAGKRDANEPLMVEALRKAGWLVMYLDKFDLLIWHPTQRRLRMVEVKTETGALKPSQEKMIAEGWPLEIVRTIDQALRP